MATYYVDSNATGAADGTSFADAYTSLNDIPGITSSTVENDLILVASDHSENVGVGFDIGNSAVDDWITVISVNSSTEVYEAGATITSTNQEIGFSFCTVYGFTINAGTGDFDGANSDEPAIFVDCTITGDEIDTTTTSGPFEFVNCSLTLSNSLSVFDTGHVTMRGGSLSAPNINSGSGICEVPSTAAGFYEFYGVDFSSVDSDVDIYRGEVHLGNYCYVRVVNCELPASTSFGTTRPSEFGPFEVELIGCNIPGSSLNPQIQYRYHSYNGDVESDTSRYRAGGASDGTTPYSWRVTLNHNANDGHESLRGRSLKVGREGFNIPVEVGDTNIRIHFAHDGIGTGTGGRLTTADIWSSYVGPSQAGTPDNQGHNIENDLRYGQTATDLPDSSASWTGSDVGTRQYMDIAIAPTVAGMANIIVNAAIETTGSDISFSVCPRPEVS